MASTEVGNRSSFDGSTIGDKTFETNFKVDAYLASAHPPAHKNHLNCLLVYSPALSFENVFIDLAIKIFS